MSAFSAHAILRSRGCYAFKYITFINESLVIRRALVQRHGPLGFFLGEGGGLLAADVLGPVVLSDCVRARTRLL